MKVALLFPRPGSSERARECQGGRYKICRSKKVAFPVGHWQTVFWSIKLRFHSESLDPFCLLRGEGSGDLELCCLSNLNNLPNSVSLAMWQLVITTQVMNDPLLSASSLSCCQNHSQEYYCMSCLRKCPRSLADSQGHCIGRPFSCSAFICSWSPKLTLGKHGSLQGTAFPRRDFHVWSSIWELKTLPKPKTDQIWRKCWKGSVPES